MKTPAHINHHSQHCSARGFFTWHQTHTGFPQPYDSSYPFIVCMCVKPEVNIWGLPLLPDSTSLALRL